MKRRLLSISLALALCLTLLPTAAWAADEGDVMYDYDVSYIDENGEERICEAATVVTSDTTTWGGDPNKEYWYVVKDRVDITDPITVKGNVRLILAGGLKADGIDVSTGNSLTIYSQAGSSDYVHVTNMGGAGIGNTERCGTIAIHGGNMNVGGVGVDIGGPGGRVTITGGAVIAEQADPAISGTSVRIDGDAVVIARSGTIGGNNDDRKNWRGVVFEEHYENGTYRVKGRVYGENVTLPGGTVSMGGRLTSPFPTVPASPCRRARS